MLSFSFSTRSSALAVTDALGDLHDRSGEDDAQQQRALRTFSRDLRNLATPVCDDVPSTAGPPACESMPS